MICYCFWNIFILCSVWSIATGDLLNIVQHHTEAVLHLRFQGDMLVTCSKVCYVQEVHEAALLRLRILVCLGRERVCQLANYTFFVLMQPETARSLLCSLLHGRHSLFVWILTHLLFHENLKSVCR